MTLVDYKTFHERHTLCLLLNHEGFNIYKGPMNALKSLVHV